MRIGVIAVQGAFDIDVLSVAEKLRETVDPETPQIEHNVCGVGGKAVTQRGLCVPIERQLLGVSREVAGATSVRALIHLHWRDFAQGNAIERAVTARES